MLATRNGEVFCREGLSFYKKLQFDDEGQLVVNRRYGALEVFVYVVVVGLGDGVVQRRMIAWLGDVVA